jgi:hypothetical protein
VIQDRTITGGKLIEKIFKFYMFNGLFIGFVSAGPGYGRKYHRHRKGEGFTLSGQHFNIYSEGTFSSYGFF